jgi:hypothetical protein
MPNPQRRVPQPGNASPNPALRHPASPAIFARSRGVLPALRRQSHRNGGSRRSRLNLELSP